MFAQQIDRTVYSSAGKCSSSSNLTISCTIGEPIVFTGIGSNVILSQGFQQPDKDVVTIINSSEFLMNVNVFPNPVNDQLQVRVNANLPLSDLFFEIDDLFGKKIEMGLIPSDISWDHSFSLNFVNFSAGVYIVKISSQKSHINKAFKVIKK